MAMTACELKWLKKFLLALGVEHSDPIKMYYDSQVALCIAANPVFHERTKHIKIYYHFVHNEV